MRRWLVVVSLVLAASLLGSAVVAAAGRPDDQTLITRPEPR